MLNPEDFIQAKTLRWSKNDGIQYLMKLGLTRIQASLYLNLLLKGKADAHLLSYWASLPRTEVYRSLNELQQNGLVDREVSSPLKFSAVTPSLGLQALIDRKSNEIGQMQKTLKEFLREFENRQEQENEQDYKITIIEGRKRIMAKIKQQHENARFTVDIASFLPRFLQIANELQDHYKKAVARGVKYRLIIALPDERQVIPVNILEAHNNKNTVMKTVIGSPKINSAIFDRQHASFSYYPDRSITESPYVVTNHPCIVEFAHDSFEQRWNSL